MGDDPNFFKDWMDARRLKSDDVAGPLQVSEQTIRQWRAYGVPPRRVPHVQKYMAAWKEPSDGYPPEIDQLRVENFLVNPSPEQFDAWNLAAMKKGQTIREWINCTLQEAAEEWARTGRLPEDIPQSQAESIITFPELPLLRAAAGVPLLADAEHVQPDRELGKGRFLLELRGDSMEPRFRDRQRVVLRDKATLKRPALKYGEFYCFVHEGQACFKQWAKDASGNRVLRSLNPEHADIPVDGETDWIGWFDPTDNR